MTDMAIEQEVEPLKVEDLDKYLVAAGSIVGELGDFLASHYEELVKCHMTIHGKGIAMDAPLAAQDPACAAHIHKLKNACESFCNVLRNSY